jgi:hypothetical protein
LNFKKSFVVDVLDFQIGFDVDILRFFCSAIFLATFCQISAIFFSNRLVTLGSTLTILGGTKFISNDFMGMFVRFGRRRKVGIPNITEVTKLS